MPCKHLLAVRFCQSAPFCRGDSLSSLYIESDNGYAHRIIAEKKIGRKLKSTEVVHHIDENKQNNDPNNLMIFKSQAAHVSYHHGGELISLEDGTFDCKSVRLKCIGCNKLLDYKNKSGYCRLCYNIQQRKIKNRPSKSELLKLLVTNSYCAIGRIYGVSDNTIRKWLK